MTPEPCPRGGELARAESSFIALLVSVLVLAFAASARAQPVAPEPSYESACANWPPVLYGCAVLSPKNSRAKFISSFRGGVHTVYVSEVLGHCPLLPGRADLMALIPDGVQVLFSPGDPPDFRTAPRADICQRLARGYLPIVETTWEDPSGRFRYEETDFVRILGEGVEAVRGDENSAASIRLRILNLSKEDGVAKLHLSINGSTNAQPRGVAAPEYLGGLRADGCRVLTSAGRVRLIWKAPDGTVSRSSLRERAPAVLEWLPDKDEPDRPLARAEAPFNRYYRTKAAEMHDATKAFDRLGMTYWTPPSKGPAGLGIEFPEARLLRQVTVRFEEGLAPRASGYRFEALEGGAWKAMPHRVNGKTPEELRTSPDAERTLGAVWTFSMEPVKTRGFRLAIDGMPEGKDRPAIAEVGYSYALEDSPERWFDTASDYHSNFIALEVPVRGASHADVFAAVPFAPCSAEEARWLGERSFEDDLARVTAFWEAAVRAGARLELPEQIPEEVWHANAAHVLTTGEIDPTNGLAITKTNIGWYEAVWASLSSVAIIGLDMRGLHEDAARYLEPFLRWQGSMEPPGKFSSREGFLAAADEYTWVRWLSGHGWLLWALAEHYLLSGDRVWLERALPHIIAACDWIERERATNKKAGPDGSRPAHWGLLPPGPTGDGAPNSYSFFGEACAWRGLDAAAAVLRDIGHPRAEELERAAGEYRECILSAMREGTRLAPVYQLKSGLRIPFVPMDLYNGWKINTGGGPFDRHPWYLDVGPLHTIDLGVLDARTDLAGWMLQTLEDYWLKHSLAIDEPWYAPQAYAYYGRDQLHEFLGVYYNLLAEGMDRQVYAPVEGHGGVQNLPWGDGEHTRILRRMLVHEEGNVLHIARAVPRAWLAHGKRIAFRKAPTRFGKVSFAIESSAIQGSIRATIDPPDRKPVPIALRLRHPTAAPLKSVTVNGKPHTAFGTEWIQLPAGTERLEVTAGY